MAADWLADLPDLAAAVYAESHGGADLPPKLAAALTPPALADWLADHPDAWTADAPHGSPADRTAPLSGHVSRATLRAALQGPDAMKSLAAAIPQPAAASDLDKLAAMFAPLVDSSIPPDLDGMAWLHALYIADRPHVRRRRGRVPVDVDLADLARELWPGTPAAPSQHGAALDRTLTESDAYRVGVDGGLLFPVRRTLWTPPDAIARGAQRFDVTYGVRGGNGPAYDRWLMRDAGPEPRRFLAYLAYVSAVDRGGRVDLDALADAVSLGLAPAQRRDRRHSAIEALEWLADWRPPLLGPDGRPMLDGKGKPRPDHAAAARVVYDVTRQFGGPDRLTLRRPPALPALPASDESGP